ncbi:MAG: flavodoxin family protein [Planctomycetota bacterium]
MSAQLVAIAGSPRRGGNTELLLDEFLAGLQEKGVTWEKIRVADLAIEDCRACGGCSRSNPPGRCVIEDAMRDVLDRLRAAQGYVLATPIWFGGPPAALKAMIDRCQALWATDPTFSREKSKKPAALLVVGGMHLLWQDPGVRVVARSFFAALYARIVGELFIHDVDARGEILKHPDLLAKARELGRDLAGGILHPGPPA